MPSRIYKGDKIERVTWDTINEFLEEQKALEQTAMMKALKPGEDPMAALEKLNKHFDNWKKTLDKLGEMAQGAKKRVEDTALKKIIPRPLTGSAVVIRFFVTPQLQVQFQKSEIDFTLRSERTGRRVL
jgi:hypothetical protein